MAGTTVPHCNKSSISRPFQKSLTRIEPLHELGLHHWYHLPGNIQLHGFLTSVLGLKNIGLNCDVSSSISNSALSGNGFFGKKTGCFTYPCTHLCSGVSG